MKNRKHAMLATLIFIGGITSPAAYAQNLLVNPGFENPPLRANGDVYIGSNSGNMANWTIQGGSAVNVVQVDGSGGYSYSGGPQQDASTVPAGQLQRYVDFATGNISIHQSFVAKCTANYRFGAAFSNRVGSAGSGNTSVVSGNIPTGAVVASSSAVSFSNGNSTYNWLPSAGTAALVAGQTYTFKIQMSQDYMNVDSAFVEQAGECAEVPIDVPGNHWQCYRVVEGDTLKPEKLTVQDQFGRAEIVLARPLMLCNPSLKMHGDKKYKVEFQDRHLVCYQPIKETDQPTKRKVKINNQMAPATLVLAERQMFCVPSKKNRLDAPDKLVPSEL